MKIRSVLLLLIAVVGGSAGRLDAHHSIAGVYDSGRQVTVAGIVKEFHFVNPHPFIIVEIHSAGRDEAWKLELDNRSELSDVGVTDQTFQPGDRVTVSGNPIRPPQSRLLYVRKLERAADGFEYEQVGNSPRIHRTR